MPPKQSCIAMVAGATTAEEVGIYILGASVFRASRKLFLCVLLIRAFPLF